MADNESHRGADFFYNLTISQMRFLSLHGMHPLELDDEDEQELYPDDDLHGRGGELEWESKIFEKRFLRLINAGGVTDVEMLSKSSINLYLTIFDRRWCRAGADSGVLREGEVLMMLNEPHYVGNLVDII